MEARGGVGVKRVRCVSITRKVGDGVRYAKVMVMVVVVVVWVMDR